jgi:tetrahydromethanopterin S-methyltransferase subunit C
MHVGNQPNPGRRFLRKSLQVLAAAVILALIGAMVGTLYGSLVGLTRGIARQNMGRIVHYGTLFGLVGAGIGAVCGILGQLLASVRPKSKPIQAPHASFTTLPVQKRTRSALSPKQHSLG